MFQKILHKRGLKANLPSLDVGELALCTDTNEVFMGSTNGNFKINGSSSSVSDLIIEDFSAGDSVEMLLPMDVTKVWVTDSTKTSITISWLPSLSSDVNEYSIYNGVNFLGTTVNTTFQVTGLNAATNYAFTIKTKNFNDVESNGYILNTRTNGNYVLNLNKQYLETPELTFSMVEATWNVTPKVSSWNNAFISQSNGLYGLTTQFDGARFITNNMSILIDGNVLGNNDSIPVGQTKTYQMKTDSNIRIVTDSLAILGFTNGNTTDMQATVYRIKFWKLDDYENYELVADYDFTYNVTNGLIQDVLGKNPPMIMHGGTFINN
jgi:hypothetical protein